MCDDDIETPSEIPQSLTALKVMTQITSESKKREIFEKPEGDESGQQIDEDDSCQFDLELDR